MNFTREELVNMVYCIGDAERNPLLARKIYQAKYPQGRIPDSRSFGQLRDRFEETGSVDYKKRKNLGSRLGDVKELEVLLKIQENPEISSREIAIEVDVSQSSVNRIIKKHKFHPYHIELHQELTDEDFQRRMHFCEEMLTLINANYRLLSHILFSDEATFKSNGSVNRHNMHYYSLENPHWLRTLDHQNRWSLNVWGGIVDDHVIGPFFFEGTLTGDRYLRFLHLDLPPLLEDVNLNLRREMWYQQDGAPVHFQRNVRDYLNEMFPNRWIGRGGSVAWPARSPDLTPIDFFLWGYTKDRVYQTKPSTAEDMKNRIREAFHSITPDMLARVRLSFIERSRICIRENGRQFEHLL